MGVTRAPVSTINGLISVDEAIQARPGRTINLSRE